MYIMCSSVRFLKKVYEKDLEKFSTEIIYSTVT